jgi:hypothetical protein
MDGGYVYRYVRVGLVWYWLTNNVQGWHQKPRVKLMKSMKEIKKFESRCHKIK